MRHKALLSAVFILGLSALSLPPGVQASTKNLGEGHTPSISSDGHGHVFVVFEGVDSKTGAADIYYSSSSDGGKTWTRRLDVYPTAGVSTRPRVAVEKNGAIDVVWTDTAYGVYNPEIYFTRSTDYGRTWVAPINISQTPGASRDPQLAIGPDDSIHVIFADTPTAAPSRDIFYTSSTDGGKTWSKDRQLENVSNTPSDSSEPTLAIAPDGTVHAAWKEEDPSPAAKHQIYYSQRSQNVWSPARDISNPRRYSYHPVIACGSNGKVYINWLDRADLEGAADVWCMEFNGNAPLPQPIRISDTGSIASSAEMTTDRTDRTAVVWPDRSLGLTLPRIRLKMLANASKDSHRPIKIAHSSAIQMAPALALDGDKLTVVWEERSLNSNPIKVKSIDLPKLFPRN
ncbi:MAG: exo-alpha-sialidase [Candidatus Melainabacteria bacterium]|nr:exo-alpha-sialidase [Candidatus Melainabacteria bacterium]